MKKLLLVLASALLLTSCTENYSNGERVGLVTQFSETGIMWKSWEGHLNLTQTGMNSSTAAPFDFSIDNDRSDIDNEKLIKTIDSAAQYGWKIKIIYHETFGKNWLRNRGETDHFISKVEVLDKNPVQNAFSGRKSEGKSGGKVVDTIYVVIVPKPTK